jgi:membrane protein
VNILQKTLTSLNAYQQKHRSTAFISAVIKKYGDDEAGRQAALLTYYAFLSLFPLLLLVTTVTNALIGRNTHLETTVINAVTNYFPLLGGQLASHVHKLNASGFALISGILFTLYGTRGLADNFRRMVCKFWLIPDSEREGFPASLFKSLTLIIVGGLLFILASVAAGLVASAGYGLSLKLLSVLLNLLILFGLFLFMLNYSLPRHVKLKDVRLGALTLAISLTMLQLLGTYILGHELKHLDALYSYFAIALGLLFWLYLQAQIVCYSVEIAVVSSKKLWPRSFYATQPSTTDPKLANT